MHFAAFVMTYRRPEILAETIRKLFSQTSPPEKILIVDNDPEQSAFVVKDRFTNNHVDYYSVGYNSGPAGAAYHGLKILTSEGWEWIGWIDDDDPPYFDNTFEVLIHLAKSNPKIGCVGSVGHRFNLKRGIIERIDNKELAGEGVIYVDNIAGNMSKLINAEVIRHSKILPDPTLFFGFEELDFDLRLKKSGYLLVCDKSHYLKHRQFHNRMAVNKRPVLKKSYSRLIRDYYSYRNGLFILKNAGSLMGITNMLLRILLKMTGGFRFGIKYGLSNSRILFLSLIHFIKGKKGMTFEFPTATK